MIVQCLLAVSPHSSRLVAGTAAAIRGCSADLRIGAVNTRLCMRMCACA